LGGKQLLKSLCFEREVKNIFCRNHHEKVEK
jgi:hypothetical protein